MLAPLWYSTWYLMTLDWDRAMWFFSQKSTGSSPSFGCRASAWHLFKCQKFHPESLPTSRLGRPVQTHLILGVTLPLMMRQLCQHDCPDSVMTQIALLFCKEHRSCFAMMLDRPVGETIQTFAIGTSNGMMQLPCCSNKVCQSKDDPRSASPLERRSE